MSTTFRTLPPIMVHSSFLLVLLTVCGGIVSGLCLYVASRLVYLVIIFPFALGGINGVFLAHYVRTWKLPLPTFVIICALVMTMMSYITYHGAIYVQFWSEARAALIAEYPQADPNEIDFAIHRYLQDTTGFDGIAGYLVMTANSGITIGRWFTNIGAIPLTGMLVWIYWIIEFLIIAGSSIFIAHGAARQRFCFTCGQWYQSTHIGSINDIDPEQITTMLATQQWREFIDTIENVNQEDGYDVYYSSCICPNESGLITVSHIVADYRGRTRVVDLASAEVSSGDASLFHNKAVQLPAESAHTSST